MGIRALGLAQAAVERPQIDLSASVLEALDRLRVAITLFDAQERLTYCNTHYHYILRSLPPAESLIGATYESLIQLEIAGGEIDQYHLDNVETFVEERRRRLLESDFRPFDVRLSDGRVIELKSRGTLNGGHIVLWSDATYSRKLLGRLEDTIELSVDAFAFWNEKDWLTLCNTAFAEMHGFATPEEARGFSFTELMKRALTQGRFAINGSVTAWLERRIDAHGSAAGALTLSTTDGASYLVRERATRGGSVTVLTDVSERHRAESALAEQTLTLQRTKRALQKSKTESKRRASFLADLTRRLDMAESEVDTAKATLLRTMSHELKTPLNAIIGFADLLRASPERFDAAQIGEYATLIHKAGGNLLRLINQILDLTKIAAGRYPLRRAPVSVAAAIASAYDLHTAQVESKALRVNCTQCAGDLLADADENALTVMLGHLLENAVTYTQPGGLVSVSVAREDVYIRVTISDNGPGVAEADLERILEPFEQGGRGTTDHSFGTGLGLPIVRALADLHGGSLTVASVLGEGFTATLEIPSV
jgi:two-component system, cell cycle sensor histidine kinase PleC